MNFKYDQHASHLTESDWKGAVEYLEAYFPGIKSIVKNINAKIQISTVWPRFEIVKSQSGYLNILRFELNPNYLNDNLLSFNCYMLKFKRKLILKNELMSKEHFFSLSKEEMSNTEENIKRLEDICRYLG